MVPAGRIAEQTVRDLAERMEAGDVIIDGGNSYYRDDIARTAALADERIHYLDVGTSGGVWGLSRRLLPDDRWRSCGRRAARAAVRGDRARRRGRRAHAGPRRHARDRRAGLPALRSRRRGSLREMVHNGIEYGVMAAYAEGLNILKNANAGTVERDADAETAPLDHPEYYQYELDIASVTEVWRRGRVIASWLLDLTAAALPKLIDDGYLLGLVTGNLEAVAHIKPHRAQLNRFFSFGGYGSDSTDRGELTRIALNRATLVYGEPVTPEQAIVVGDTPHDVDGAHAAGMACVGVGSHNFDVDQLRAADADYVIVSLTEPLPL
jgi:phosphoglycolate phosphatase-like HAD superfamily hydrolase